MKKSPNRKRRAIRCLAVAVVLILLYNSYGWGFLLPHWALRFEEETRGTGRTDILYVRPDLGAGGVVYLSANENAMIAARFQLVLWGWQAQSITVENCTESKTIRCDLRTFRRRAWEDYGGTGVTYWYGRVENPDITEVQLTCQVGMQGELSSDIIPGTERDCTVTTTQRDWKESDGARYFLVRLEPLDTAGTRAEYSQIVYTAYDAEGNVVTKLLS